MIRIFFMTAVMVIYSCVASCEAFSAGQGVNLGELVVTSSGHEENAVDFPGNITVITKKDIERSNAHYVYELLRQEPGIQVTDFSHSGKAVTVDLRGFGDTAARNLLVMIDGRRINEIDISGVDWSQIPIENVERIEILRGSGSVLYGDNAASGVINIITKKGRGSPSAQYGYEGGSYRFQKHFAGASGSTDFMQYNLFGKFEETDGYRLNGGYEGYNYDANATMHPSPYLSIDLSGGYHKDRYGLPSGLRRTQIDQIGRTGSRTPYDWARTETGYVKLSPTIDVEDGRQRSTFTVDAWARKKRLKDQLNADWGPPFGMVTSEDASQIDSMGATVKYIFGYDFGTARNEATFGLDLFRAVNRILGVTPAVATFNQLKITKESTGIYAADKITIGDRVIINGGFRQEWTRYVFDQQDNVTRYESREPKQEAFECGVEYKYTEKGALYGRYARTFRFPSTDEFFSQWNGLNTNLKHQRSDTWEVGVKDDTIRYLMTHCGFFVMDTKNEIFVDPTVGFFGDNRNYDHTRREGLELSVASDISEQIRLYGNYTYLNVYFVGGVFAGKRVPMVPRDKISWGVRLAPYEYIAFDFWSDYIGVQFPINDQFNRQPKLKDYLVCNGKATLKYKGWETFFGVNNIFNQKYSEIAATNAAGTALDYYPAPEINYRFGASCKF